MAAALALCAQTPASPHPSLAVILASHLRALARLGVREPASHETIGTLTGDGLVGEFHEWQAGDDARRDERLGLRTQRTLRVGDRLWVQNENGETRELTGLLARRQITEDFIASGAFARHPELVTFLGTATLPDGRVVYRLRVAPPLGESYVVGIDAKDWLVDEESYEDHARPFTITFAQYHVIHGYLVPYVEVDSNGDRAYDVTLHVQQVVVDRPIPPEIFAALRPVAVTIASPVTTSFEEHGRLIFTNVTIAGRSYHFLIDSGSQGNVIDPRVARQLGLKPQGTLEVTGTARTASRGIVALPDLQIAGVPFPAHVATVLDLSSVVAGTARVDGVLGFPFFESAEVRLDPTRHTLTIAKPGTLPLDGEKLAVDTDRAFPEVVASVNGVKGRFVVDTGDTQELLLFKSFITAHPGLISYVGDRSASDAGIGGSMRSITVVVNDLTLGGTHLYNRYADVILADAGAFSSTTDGGNIGYGTLHNFVVTFDLANGAIYLQKAQGFDDGRFRTVVVPGDGPPGG